MEISAIKGGWVGGGVRRLIANAILNIHFCVTQLKLYTVEKLSSFL